jgi:hypothetical protein
VPYASCIVFAQRSQWRIPGFTYPEYPQLHPVCKLFRYQRARCPIKSRAS